MPEDTVTSLDDSVKAAVEEHTTEQKVDEKVESKEAEKPVVEDKPAPAPEIDEKTKNAVTLYDALVNPDTREETVKYLMKQAGLDTSAKSDVKAAKQDTITFLKAKLGDTYADFAEVLGPAFDELLAAKLSEHTKPLEEKVTRAELSAAEQAADAAMESLFSRHEIPKGERAEIEAAMEKKIRQMPAVGDMTIEEYLDDIYFLVSRSRAEGKAVRKTVDKINRNAKDASRTSGVEIDEKRVNRGSHLPTLDEAVKAAMRGEKLE